MNQLNTTITKETTRHINLIIQISERIARTERIYITTLKTIILYFKTSVDIWMKHKCILMKPKGWKVKKLRHRPSSETGKSYSEVIKKKNGILNRLRKDYDFE